MEQTLELFDDGENTIETIQNLEPGKRLVRCMENNKWTSKMVSVAWPAVEETPEIALDDITAARLKKLPGTGPCEEIDIVHLSGTITDHEPPYYCLLLAGVNEKKLATRSTLLKPFTDYYQTACDELAQSFLTCGKKPRMIFLKNGSTFAEVFSRIAAQAGIECVRQDELPNLPDFTSALDEDMKNSKPW